MRSARGFSPSRKEYESKKIDCPSGGRQSALRAEAALHAAVDRERELWRKGHEDRGKLALIERMEARGRRVSGKPSYFARSVLPAPLSVESTRRPILRRPGFTP